MKRLLIIYHFFPHYRKGVIEALADSSMDVFFAGDPNGISADAPIKPYKIENNFIPLFFRGIFGPIYRLSGIFRAFRKSRPHVVIFLGDMNCVSVWIWGIICRLRGKRVMFWAHGWIDDSEVKFKKAVRKLFFKIPNVVLLYGRRARRMAASQGFDPKKLFVIYNSLDYQMQNQIYQEAIACRAAGIKSEPGMVRRNNHPLIICSARLTSLKRFDLVILAASLFSMENRPDILFIGDGPERANLQFLADRENVLCQFVGECYDEVQLSSWIMNGDMVVSPGNVGLTAVHSMVYGTPVITHSNRNHQMPEAEAVIDGVTGCLFEEGSVNSLSDAIWRISSLSVREKKEMSLNCRSMISRFFQPLKQVEKLEAAIYGEDEYEPIVDEISESELS